jgi:hypothetical protein
MALPYPTMSGSFVPTGAATVDEFSAPIVHSDAVHNNPHAKLLANDVSLNSRVQVLESSLVLTRITPTLVYQINNVILTPAYLPVEWRTSSIENVANNGTYQIHSYPGSIPTPASSVVVQCVTQAGTGSNCYIRLKATSFPDCPIVRGAVGSNEDTLEMPYEAARIFQSYCYGEGSLYVMQIFVVGYRV